MTSFDATKPTIDASNSSPFDSSMPNRDENDVMSTRLPHCLSCHAKAEGAFRDALEGDDRQVLAAGAILDAQFDDRTWPCSNESV